ncbi:acyl-CoA dehydrogenase family protein [Flavisphingomonas formosensis]|uniref:acyl-CoA dehydrogenase family protein n=1 Tax=Flavisphingomonas formosensis TaxID=861534 RepID=UPI0012FAC3C0|nr:acyl-CoA dehydrogenase family protein [Sphingomonas formosensis]
MNLTLNAEETAFRDEVRAFLSAHLPERLRRGARLTPTVFAEPDIGREWHRILYEKGWIGHSWPARFGGTGWDPVRRYIFEKECALADAPRLPVLSLRLLAPVLQHFGSAAQQQRYLPRILSGEHYWCQGFSEPQSGSDLASLRTRAAHDGTQWVLNGSKLWTTHAQFADHIFCLARTDATVKPQAGISFFLVDMNQPGVEVRPIIGLAGDHEVNAIFLDDVKVPDEDLVGEPGQGWTIAKFLLENERGGSCHAPALLARLARLRAAAAALPGDDARPIGADAAFQAALCDAECEAQALEITELRILADIAQGLPPGPQTSLVKMVASTLEQTISTIEMRMYGYAGLQLATERPLYGEAAPDPVLSIDAQMAAPRYLNNRAWTIFGGSNEIQRTIIAKTVLGL